MRKKHNSLRRKYFEGVLINILPSKNTHQTQFIISPIFIKSILKESMICLPTTTTGAT